MKKIFIVCLFFVFVSSVRATGEFSANYEVNYSVSSQGTTIVTQNITLINKLTNLYPKRYNILLDSDRIKNVVATDEKGVITPTLAIINGKTEIGLDLNTQNAGIGKVTSFSLRYEHADIAHKNGRIWEILIPGVENDDDLGSYNVSLSVPASLGQVAYLNPPPVNGHWSKEQMIRGGISAAYGSDQAFEFTISYFLENPSVASKIMEIALPPDTAYQTVFLKKINPPPQTVKKDTDGNWLAEYSLSPGQKLNIQAELAVSVYLRAKETWSTENFSVDDYLKPLRYWEVYDPKIKALAQTYKTPREIYTYVTQALSYDYDRVTQNPVRLGALGILDSPKSAICMEFSDLFIAIARAAGIPAREVVGFAYTTNSKLRPLSLASDVLHAWPEYFDAEKNLWIPVDPTWADTTGGVNYFDTLDFNHIVFAIHGQSSEYPYPAGFYRDSSKTGKDIQVHFIEDLEQTKNEIPLAVDIQFPNAITGGITTAGSIILRNTNERAIGEVVIRVQSDIGNVQIHTVQNNIPPFGVIEIPIVIKAKPFYATKNGSIVVSVDASTFSHSFTVRPLYWIFIPVSLAIFIILIIFFLWKYLRH